MQVAYMRVPHYNEGTLNCSEKASKDKHAQLSVPLLLKTLC